MRNFWFTQGSVRTAWLVSTYARGSASGGSECGSQQFQGVVLLAFGLVPLDGGPVEHHQLATVGARYPAWAKLVSNQKPKVTSPDPTPRPGPNRHIPGARGSTGPSRA